MENCWRSCSFWIVAKIAFIDLIADSNRKCISSPLWKDSDLDDNDLMIIKDKLKVQKNELKEIFEQKKV